jgi:hypothetical protein
LEHLSCDGDLGHLEDNIEEWLTTFAPILISSLKVVSDQSLIGSDVASVRRKLPRLYAST